MPPLIGNLSMPDIDLMERREPFSGATPRGSSRDSSARSRDHHTPRGGQQSPRGQRPQSPRGQRPQSPRKQRPQSPRQQLQSPRQQQQQPDQQRSQSPRKHRPQSPRQQRASSPRRSQSPRAAPLSARKESAPNKGASARAPPPPKPSPPQQVARLEISDVETDPIVALAREKATELQSAAVYGSVDVVAELCASPRVHMYLDQGVGAAETTALMCAAQAGRADVVQVLLDAGAEVDACDAHGRSSLIFAAANGEVALLAPLLSRGASPAARANNGWTALMFACALGQYEAAGALLEAALGARDEQTLQGTQQALMAAQSALGLARLHAQPEVVALLEALLAQEDALDVDAALLKAQEAWREGGRRVRGVMNTDDPPPVAPAGGQ